MASNSHKILCGTCRIPLEALVDCKGDDQVTCASCGQHDTLDNILSEVKTFTTEAVSRHLQKSLGQSTRQNKFVKITTKPVQQRSYRFVVDLDL